MKPARLKVSQKQEKRVAKRNGGRVQAQSGAGPWHKEDVKTDQWLIQNKATVASFPRSITLKVTDLETLEQNAALESRLPAMQLDIGMGRQWWVIPSWVVAQELGLHA